MTISPTFLVRGAAASAIAGGAIFAGVQVALAGITGLYLSQIRRNGLLGLIGYVVLAAGYLGIMCVAFVAAYVLPELASDQPRYVGDVIAANTGRGEVVGDIGALSTRLLAYPTAIALIALGFSLWRSTGAATSRGWTARTARSTPIT